MIDAWLQKRRIKRIQREIELEQMRQQALCLHKWSYIGTKDVEYYTGIDVDYYTTYIVYCPHCDLSKSFNKRSSAEQAVEMAKLREEASE